MRRVIFVMSCVLLLLSIFANILSYVLTVYYPLFQLVFIIHVLIFIPFGAMIIYKRNAFKTKVPISFNPLDSIRILIPNAPNPVLAIVLMASAFTFINFYLGFAALSSGSPEILNGLFVQNNHGSITQITEQLYNKLKYAEIRLFSGHWILFSIVPMFAFLYDGEAIKKEKYVD